MRTGHALIRAVAAACCGLLQTAPSTALDLAYEASLGAGHSDNIARTEDNEIDETIGTAGLRFSLDQHSTRLRANAAGDLAYNEYLDDTFDSEVLGNAAANVRLGIVPERIEWEVADHFGQTLNDPFTPATPDNRENVNVFSTGPDIFLGLGSQTRVRLGGRYGLVNYEDRPFDSDSISGTVALIRNFTAASSASINARLQEVEYDETALNADYEQRDAYLEYELNGARSSLLFDVGYTEIERDVAEDKESGLLLRLDASRRATPSTTWSLRAGREFSTSAGAFVISQTTGGMGLDATPGEQTAQPFTNDYVGAGWAFDRNRTSLGLSALWNDQSYDDAAGFDQTLKTAQASFGRELSTSTSLTIDALYTAASFDVATNDYDEVSAGLGFRWRLSSATSLSFTYRFADRTSDAPAGEYTENRFFASIAYGYGQPRTSFAPPAFDMNAGE